MVALTMQIQPEVAVWYHQHRDEVGARTETTVNNTRGFSIGKRLCNLPALRQVGFSANRRLLEVQPLSHDCAMGRKKLKEHEEELKPLRIERDKLLAEEQTLLKPELKPKPS